VAKGYWNKYSETESTFGARLEPGGEGPFLRSGDLGFIYQDELYITGRFKNLIITDGKNHYPQDIERTVQGAHPAIRPAGCAAFSIDDADLGRERIIIVAELERWLNSDREEIIKAILKAVADNHGLHADDIKLVIPGSIPRTTSGKIRHFICKSTYLAGALKEINLT
jgi:acyl-CoA synthetase (AMP-forming)/AMP-acid ligase II